MQMYNITLYSIQLCFESRFFYFFRWVNNYNYNHNHNHNHNYSTNNNDHHHKRKSSPLQDLFNHPILSCQDPSYPTEQSLQSQSQSQPQQQQQRESNGTYTKNYLNCNKRPGTTVYAPGDKMRQIGLEMW